MSRTPLASVCSAPRRAKLIQVLTFLWLLGGLLWSYNQAQASPIDADMVFFMAHAEVHTAQETAADLGVKEGCRMPVVLEVTVADLLCLEVEQAVRLRWQISRVLKHAAPFPAPQRFLPEAGQQPLLRPPATLG